MIAVVLGSIATVEPSMPGALALFSRITSAPQGASGLASIPACVGLVWVAMIPAITVSIAANAAVSVGVMASLRKWAVHVQHRTS